MPPLQSVEGRSVNFDKGSARVRIPKAIVERHEIEDGDTLVFEDDGEEIRIRPPSR